MPLMRPDPDDAPAPPVRPDPGSRPVLPEHSDEESGVGWNEAPEPDDEERLRGERPPHWDQ